MADFRTIILFKAPTSKEAVKLSDDMAKLVKGKVDRVTTPRETWATVTADEEPEVPAKGK